MQKTLPNVILVGTQKSGTTALYNWLSQHPDVFGEPAMKDFPFFCSDGYLDKGLDWFSQRFAGWDGEKIILHGYVHYLYYAAETSELFSQMLPDVKLLAVLRNPIDRAYSSYLQARKTGREKISTFEQAIDHEIAGGLQGFDDRTNRGYIDHGRYSQQLKVLMKNFDHERLKILFFEDLNEDPASLCRDVFNFIGVTDKFAPNFTRKNDYGVPRTKIMNVINSPNIFSKLVKPIIPLNARIRMRLMVNQLNTKPAAKPELPESIRQRLLEIFDQEIRDLEELTGRSLARWREI